MRGREGVRGRDRERKKVGVRGEGMAHRSDSMPFKPPVPCWVESDPGIGFTSTTNCVCAAMLSIAVPATRR